MIAALLACHPAPDPQTSTPLPDATGDTAEDTSVPADPDGIEALRGLTFVPEGLPPGIASYAFEGADEVYIDYSAAPPYFVRDDGTPLPDHAPFVDVDFDGVRTFHGAIDWSDGATVVGAARWEYEMVFDEDYSRIASGTIDAFGPDGMHQNRLLYGIELFYVRAP